MAAFQVGPADYAAAHGILHGVREQVFVHEQGVPADLERDRWDALCAHVLARDAGGAAIGTGRLLPDGRIGRMAVIAAWRGRGVGEAMLETLVGLAAAQGMARVELHAQLPAQDFYARQGFVPEGAVFREAGLDHVQMVRTLDGAFTVAGLPAAIAVTTAIIHRTRRQLCLHSRQLDPGLLDAAPVQAALRRLAARRHAKQVRLIVHDVPTIQSSSAPLLLLMQRLPSVVLAKEPVDPVDTALTSACAVNDAGDYYFRRMGERLEGTAAIGQVSRSRPFADQLQRVWDRSRDCSQLRALGM